MTLSKVLQAHIKPDEGEQLDKTLKKYQSQTYEAQKESIKANNSKMKQLKFMLTPAEYDEFNEIVKKLECNNIDLFRKFLKSGKKYKK